MTTKAFDNILDSINNAKGRDAMTLIVTEIQTWDFDAETFLNCNIGREAEDLVTIAYKGQTFYIAIEKIVAIIVNYND